MWAHTIDLKLMGDDVARAYRRAGFDVKTQDHRLSFPIVTVAEPDGEATAQIQTDRDSMYACLALAWQFRDDSAGDMTWGGTQSGIAMNLRDESSGYSFLGPDRLLPHQFITGTGQAPFILGFPYILVPGSRLTLTLRPSGDGGDIHVTILGLKLYTTPYTRRVIIPDVPGLESL